MLIFSIFLLVLVVFPLCAVAGYGVYYLLSVPLRREERAALFLDLLDTALAEGRDPAEFLRAAATTRDRVLSVRFYLLVAHLERGVSLATALRDVPDLLPPRMTALLQTGLETGNLAATLPVCRRLLRDAQAQVWQGQSHLIAVFLVASPIAIFVVMILRIWIWPKLGDVARDMELPQATEAFVAVGRLENTWAIVTLAVFGVIYCVAFLYVFGPHIRHWVHQAAPGWYDRMQWLVPWSRWRLQRDFCGSLAALLDTGMAEEPALRRAGESVANLVLQKRAERAAAELQSGVSLVDAVRHIDRQGEFRWRLTNAARSGRGFTLALAGWQESLDARAFQRQQAATHAFTSLLVLWNGVMVAMVAWCMFYFLSNLIQEGVLW